MPEDLPRPEKSIKQIEKEQLKRLKDKKTKLMLMNNAIYDILLLSVEISL